ncbi:undecaprenyl-diphosphate phosphatase [Streptococcus pneumoniae]
MFIIEILKSIFFGIVEGITEWLPISSTGHLILVQEFVKYKDNNPAFIEMFNVVIQLGAILAVVVIYFDKLNPFKSGKTAREVRKTWQLWAKVVIATLPALIIGLPLDDWFEAHFHHMVPVAIMLIIYGVAFIVLEKRNKDVEPKITDLDKLPYKTALYIGFFQVLALFPGTSRSGATIVGGLLNGTSRSVVTEFTFYLGIPAMFGASGIKILKFILKGNSLDVAQLMLLLVAMGVAFGVSLLVIRFLTDYVKKHDFTIFGKYRIALGALLLVYAFFQFLLA